MKRSELEKHIGESVEVKLFDGDTMQGVLRKTGTEEVRNNPNLYLKGGYYFLSHKDTYVCKSCFADREPREWVRVLAYGEKTGRRNILHIMNRERIGQVRGVPFLAPVIDTIKQLGRYTEAEVLAAVINGLFTVFIEKESASDDVPFGESIPEEMQVDQEDENSIELAPGAVIDLGEGEKANMVNPGRPNPNFDPFVIAVLKQIGAALEIPYEILIMAFSSNYSASRAAILEFFKVVKMYRAWFVADFCQPIYEEWLSETRDEIVIKLKDQGAASVVDALDRLERKWGDMFYKVFRSITVDNGVEFSDYEGMERSALKEEKRTFVFYCHPYSSWERGTNENNNRLIRRHIPKVVDFEDTTDEEIKYIETWINNYPRGIFDFKTSAELFDEELQKLA